MHYKNGREAKNGDPIVMAMEGQAPVAGILYNAAASGGDACNGRIAQVSQYDPYANLGQCLHADDIAQLQFAGQAVALPPAAAQA